MKRIISLLLAFYVLTLVLTPCVDEEYSVGGNSRTEITAGNLPAHQDHQDCCSPFCTCNCCGIPFYVMNSLNLVKDFKLPETVAYFYSPSFHSLYSVSIWEPPKG